MQIVVSNISVEVIRKNIKNMHLSVLPPDGRVRVSAPVRLTDEAITMFVRTKLGWIKKQQEKYKCKQNQQKNSQDDRDDHNSLHNITFCFRVSSDRLGNTCAHDPESDADPQKCKSKHRSNCSHCC